MARILSGKPVSNAICAGLAPRVAELRKRGVAPTLCVVRVGAREDDLAYERGIAKKFDALGMRVVLKELDAGCAQGELMDAIAEANDDASVHGCLLFRPLPDGLDEAAACTAIDSAKDVDGVTPGSLYGVFAGAPEGFPPCTAEACVRLLEHYAVPLDGANVAVVGRSLVIGRPVAMMLLARNATVTMCHTHTRDLHDACAGADVVVACAGHAKVIGADAVREGQCLVDVGINWDEAAGRLVGDVDFDAVEGIVGAITPVPGGVGSVTTAVLAEHVVQVAENSISA